MDGCLLWILFQQTVNVLVDDKTVMVGERNQREFISADWSELKPKYLTPRF